MLYFVAKYGGCPGGAGVEVRPDALAALSAYPWPGNVRELENVVERVIAMRPEGPVTAEELPEHVRTGVRPGGPETSGATIPPEGTNLEETVNEFEKRLAAQALQMAGGRRAEAARLLGLNDRTLRHRLDKCGL